MSGRRSQRGMVLLVVLWAIALCSALVMATSTTFRSLAGIVRIDRDRVQGDALLTAGLEGAAGMVAALRGAVLTERSVTLAFPTGSVRVAITDEGGRIDIGKAPVELLTSLLHYVGAEDEDARIVAQRIVARRETETQPRSDEMAKSPAPAGKSDQPSAPPAAMPFTDVGQLADVPGMQPEWITAMAPMVTVFGGEAVNPLTASVAVLRALPSFDASRLEAFLDMRNTPFVDPDRLAFVLGPAQKYLKVQQNNVVAVDLIANTTDGYMAAAKAYIVLLRDDKQPYRVLAWTPVSPLARTGLIASLEPRG